MKLYDLLQKMSEKELITMVVDVDGVNFETCRLTGGMPKKLADREIIHIFVQDNLLNVVLDK